MEAAAKNIIYSNFTGNLLELTGNLLEISTIFESTCKFDENESENL